MVVDSHVHTRDFNEGRKDTIKHALSVARYAGVSGMFAMPNTNPPLTTRERVADYLRLADESDVKGVFFGVYLALTADQEQVRRAVDTHRDLFPDVVGFKLYAGHSTNNIGVVREEDQRAVFETLAREEYKGVLFVHAEKQALVNDTLFNASFPVTHALYARPPTAEVASIKDMIAFSRDAGFKGKLHIAHISTSEGVDLVSAARRSGLDVSCGVTPHHLLLDYTLMGTEGVQYKVNPPLRAPGVPALLVDRLERGDIDWIETDHAPHEPHEKTDLSGPCLSGLTSLHAWPLFIHWLHAVRGWTDRNVHLRTHGAVVDRFGIHIRPSNAFSTYDSFAYSPNSWRGLEERLRSLK